MARTAARAVWPRLTPAMNAPDSVNPERGTNMHNTLNKIAASVCFAVALGGAALASKQPVTIQYNDLTSCENRRLQLQREPMVSDISSCYRPPNDRYHYWLSYNYNY